MVSDDVYQEFIDDDFMFIDVFYTHIIIINFGGLRNWVVSRFQFQVTED